VYTSQSDKAIALAEKAFGSVLRLGHTGHENVPTEVTEMLDQAVNVAFVESPGRGDAFGHGYIHTDPTASPNLMQVIRCGRRPGAGHDRPLTPVCPGVWSAGETSTPKCR
jgi:esterase/lipase superfamily enzyme